MFFSYLFLLELFSLHCMALILILIPAVVSSLVGFNRLGHADGFQAVDVGFPIRITVDVQRAGDKLNSAFINNLFQFNGNRFD